MRTNADHPTDQRSLSPWHSPKRIEKAKADLLSPVERAELEAALGSLVGPIIDAKLEAKAVELVERYRLAHLATLKEILGDTTYRDQLLVSREDAAVLLSVSLSTIKRMEESGELPEPQRIGERAVRHRLVDIEAIAKVKLRV